MSVSPEELVNLQTYWLVNIFRCVKGERLWEGQPGEMGWREDPDLKGVLPERFQQAPLCELSWRKNMPGKKKRAGRCLSSY